MNRFREAALSRPRIGPARSTESQPHPTYNQRQGDSMLRPFSGKWLTLTLAVIAIAVAPVLAQETTAGIQGTVRDATGGSVAGATVEVSGPSLLGTRKVQTDDAGAYRIAALPPGVYTMIVTAKGFRTSRSGGL